ncbi:hypothetical protein [Algibacter sp.]|uniref:hypothetical protein n=1 Tax=Algibacter sp. TaxID=1872428 RepID=UPI003C70920C
MKIVKEHIVFRLLTVLLVITLLVPAGVKLAHVFEHHKHEVCTGGDTTHIHKVDLDCEFQKFQLNKHFSVSNITFEVFQLNENLKSIISQYHFLSAYQRLHFSLRGPPALI